MRTVYEDEQVKLYLGDCREVEPVAVDCVLADVPYQQTSLDWDNWPSGWLSGRGLGQSLWCFGSLRMFMERSTEFIDGGWQLSQDVVWEKQNGSNSSADRFRRVHESAAHFYRGPWENIYKAVVTTPDAVRRQVRRKRRPPHWGDIGGHSYESHDGGPRQMRSVIYAANCHGYAVHPTQKPVALLQPLIEYACPLGGTVYVPFAGSGSELIAARFLGRKAIGVEINEQRCEEAARRLSSELPLTINAVDPVDGVVAPGPRAQEAFDLYVQTSRPR
jgi:site-specific DNA-methyltransferase (adenine-specific)